MDIELSYSDSGAETIVGNMAMKDYESWDLRSGEFILRYGAGKLSPLVCK